MLRGDSRIKGKIVGDDEIPEVSWMASYPSIIWGGNNFCDQLPRSTGWLVWFKYAGEKSHHSQAELAWTNTVKTVRHYAQQFTGLCASAKGSITPHRSR